MTTVRMIAPDAMTILFQAAAETMEGQMGRVVHALPLDRLQEVMQRYRPA
jgi:D-aminopeptidase